MIVPSSRLLVPLACLAVASGPLEAAAPRCARPTVRPGVIGAGDCYHDIAMSDGTSGAPGIFTTGAFAVRTGELHPVTLALGERHSIVTGGGRLLGPGANSFSIRSWTSRTDYFFDGAFNLLMEDGGYQCILWRSLPPPVIEDIIRPDGQVVGIRMIFHAAERGDDLRIVMEAIAHGETSEDAAVELSVTVTNLCGSPTDLGVRYLSDVSVLRSARFTLGFVPPDPPLEPWATQEQEWLAPDGDHFRVSITDTPSTEPYYYFGGVSLSGPFSLDPPPTPPDRIATSDDVSSTVVGDGGGPAGTCFDWHVPVPPRSPPTGSPGPEAMAIFWNDTEATARTLAPGESATTRLWLWAFIENPVTCVAAAPPGPIECAGAETPVALDGTGSFTQQGNPLLYRWSSPDPRVRFDDPASATPVAYLPGVGVHDITLEVGIGPHTRSASLQVEVVDTTPPGLAIAPPVTMHSSDFLGSGCLASATLGATALDACTDDVSITHVTVPEIGSGDATASHDFPLGTTRIVFTATDGWGNVSTGETSVTLVDDVAPSLAVTATPSSLWPPNHRMKDIHVDAEAGDDCDAAPAIALLSIRSSERPDDRGDGSTEPDIQGATIGTEDFDFQLRAERSGRGRGREYSATYRVTDASGNETQAIAAVRVPHDQRGSRR